VVQAQPIVTNTAEITKQGAIIAKDAKVEEQKYVYPRRPLGTRRLVRLRYRQVNLSMTLFDDALATQRRCTYLYTTQRRQLPAVCE